MCKGVSLKQVKASLSRIRTSCSSNPCKTLTSPLTEASYSLLQIHFPLVDTLLQIELDNFIVADISLLIGLSHPWKSLAQNFRLV